MGLEIWLGRRFGWVGHLVGGYTFGLVGDLVVWGCTLDLLGLGWLKLGCTDNLVKWEIWLGWAELGRAGNLISFDDLAGLSQ